MTDSNFVQFYSDILVVLGTAGIIVPLVRRWGLSPVLGFLGAGAILGPFGLGSLNRTFPFLYWFTIVDVENVAGLAELGVVFLLFMVGLELSFRRLLTMRRLVFGLGGLQFLITAPLLTAIGLAVGLPMIPAQIVGMCLSLSSTAIVLELLASQGRLTTTTGRASFSILLAQDLAVIPILLFISVLAGGTSDSILARLGLELAKGATAIAIIVLAGRLLLRPLFHLVATARSADLFIAAALFVIIGAGLAAQAVGLSMALGAFVIALLLAETAYGKAIEAAVEPLKGLLLGIFFFTVGTKIDFREFLREPLWLPVAIAGLIVLKATIVAFLAGVFRIPRAAAIETGLLLGPCGEFAFVGIGMASQLQIIPDSLASFSLAATSATMVTTPLLSFAARRLAPAPSPPALADPELTVRPSPKEQHTIVVGYGRVGKVVCSLLLQHGIKFIAVDNDAFTVARDRKHGHAVYYGDASNPIFLDASGLSLANAVIVTIDSKAMIDIIVARVRETRPDVLIISRAADEKHASHLYALGVTDAVPETIEASLQLSEAALTGLGVPIGPVIASIHEKRDEFRQTLQHAAKRAGLDEIHAVKASSRP